MKIVLESNINDNPLHIKFSSHLEVDGTSSVTISDPDTLTVSPLEVEGGLSSMLGFTDPCYEMQLNQLHKETER